MTNCSMTTLTVSGTESSLEDCPRGNGENCKADEAVRLSYGTARLVDSSGNPQVGNTGLLQMKIGSTWEYVCDDRFNDVVTIENRQHMSRCFLLFFVVCCSFLFFFEGIR